jgi:mannose-6-phosphate isomerase-like protein (cupin superfamily)
MIEKINLAAKFAQFSEHWSPKIVATVQDMDVRLVKLLGEFVWHQHPDEDELFYVVSGRLLLRFRDGEVWLEPGECIVVPRGVEHMPVAPEEVHVMLIERSSVVNTGDQRNERTVEHLQRL